MLILCLALLRGAWETFLFVLVPLGVVVGALLLSTRTKRVAAFAQLAAAIPFFVCNLLCWLHRFINPFDKSLLSKLAWSHEEVRVGVMLLCFIVFAFGYLWYAVTQKSV